MCSVTRSSDRGRVAESSQVCRSSSLIRLLKRSTMPFNDSDAEFRSENNGGHRHAGIAGRIQVSLPGGRIPGFFRPWVGKVVDTGQMLKVEMGVDLRRGNVLMPQQFLNRPNITG